MPGDKLLNKFIAPLPPVHQEELLHIGAGLRFIESPTNYLRELRAKYGDTFLLDVFGFKLLMTFSPKGLDNLYGYAESDASFALATFDMIGFKTPIETLIDTDPKLFYHLLLNKKMPGYVQTITTTVDKELQRWPLHTQLDIFDAIRTLEQRVGYALWIAEEAAEEPHWPALKACFDVLDQEQAFVNPQALLQTIKNDKASERQAVAQLYGLIPQIIRQHDANADRRFAGVDFFREHCSGRAQSEKKVIHNIMNANQGFLSNLYAAIAWVLVRLVEYPEVLQTVRAEIAGTEKKFGARFFLSVDALNAMSYLEQVMMESVRLAQRSLTLRKVMQPVDFNDGEQVYRVEEGIYIATMLSVTNTQLPELETFNPDNYAKNQLADSVYVPGKETISTFGHGRHACPAQRFSHHMCKIVVLKILERFELNADFSTPPLPSDKQMGGVSRPQETVYFDLGLAQK